jgi:hypothetical protein
MLNLSSTSYPDHCHCGDLPLQRKIPTAEPGTERGTSEALTTKPQGWSRVKYILLSRWSSVTTRHITGDLYLRFDYKFSTVFRKSDSFPRTAITLWSYYGIVILLSYYSRYGNAGWSSLRRSEMATNPATRNNTSIHNILSTAPQLSISQKALGTFPEDGNVMPKHVGATIYN